VLRVRLLTRGSPDAITGGHLYQRRMAELAPGRGATMTIAPARLASRPWRRPCDVIVVDSITAWRLAPATVVRRRGVPLAGLAHQPPGGIEHTGLRKAVQRALDRLVYRRCDLVIAASGSLAEALVRDHGISAPRVCVAEPGCDLPPGRAAVDLRLGRRIALLCVANWRPNKGVLDLIEALAALSDGDATLHLAGRDDVDRSYASRVRARLTGADVAGRVIVHGPVDRQRLADLYANADVFALATYVETYGTVFGEALACGLPTVGWRAGNLQHLVTDGVEGCLVAPGDVRSLSDVLRRLARDDAWRDHLSAAARRRGSTLPTWEDTADAFFGALRTLRPSCG
jgi:glycosyltransferase involved in cell wall biosynthesis